MDENAEGPLRPISPAALSVQSYCERALVRIDATRDRFVSLRERIESVRFLIDARIAANERFLEDLFARMENGIAPERKAKSAN